MSKIKNFGIMAILGMVILATILIASKDPVASFEECVKAGYPVLDSYPEQCETPDGKRFTREIGNDEIPREVADHIMSKRDVIVIGEPKPFAEISSPLAVSGEARGPWYFEADFPISLKDGNGKILAEKFATAQLDPNDPESTWMTENFVPFRSMLEFDIPATDTGTLILRKNNPSGLPEHDDELRIPVRFMPESQVRMRTVSLYYYNPENDRDAKGNILCSKAGLVAVLRDIPLTQTPVQDTVSLLLEGEVLPGERAQGIITEFPLQGLELEGANIRNGTLTLNFLDPNNVTSGGSCRTGILWFQIEETAKQFEGIDKVQFQPEELFQP